MQCRQHTVQLGRAYEEIQKQGAEVLVVGPGSGNDAQRLVDLFKLPFPVLGDPDRAVYLSYGLDKVFRAIQRSGTFLVDPQGKVSFIEQGALPQMLNKDAIIGEIKKLQKSPA
jgi:peroxiredoxin